VLHTRNASGTAGTHLVFSDEATGTAASFKIFQTNERKSGKKEGQTNEKIEKEDEEKGPDEQLSMLMIREARNSSSSKLKT